MVVALKLARGGGPEPIVELDEQIDRAIVTAAAGRTDLHGHVGPYGLEVLDLMALARAGGAQEVVGHAPARQAQVVGAEGDRAAGHAPRRRDTLSQRPRSDMWASPTQRCSASTHPATCTSRRARRRSMSDPSANAAGASPCAAAGSRSRAASRSRPAWQMTQHIGTPPPSARWN